MIKVISLFVLLTLSACSSFAYNDSANYLYGYLFGFKSEVTKGFYDDFDFSFATIKFGRGPESIIVLAEIIEKDTYKFVSNDQIKIYVKNGFIIKTEGMENDINYIGFSGFKNYSSLTTFDNPSLYRAETSNQFQVVGNEKIKWLASTVDTQKINHSISIPIIKWKTEIYYYVDYKGNLLRTEQKFHPNIPKATINFYFK